MAISKFFRAFVEGQTISDGRTVTAEMIDEAVSTFNVETYTPGINIEHLTGFSPSPPFNRYGDVVAVKAQTDTITIDGKGEQRRALYAQVDGLDQLVTLAESGQKPFPSVELTPDYAGTGKVGLVGLAFTDNPASIATEKLKFSRNAPGTLFSSATDGIALEFEAEAAQPSGIADAITAGFARVAAMFKPTPPEPVVPPKQDQAPANDNDKIASAFTALGATFAAAIRPLADAQAKTTADLIALTSKLEATEQPGFSRQPAPGGSADAKFATDC